MTMMWFMSVVLSIALPSQDASTPPKKLVDLLPGTQWEARVLTLDCDCDGRNDRAYLGRFKGHVLVGFASAAGSSVDFLEFSVDAGAQAAICREPAKLEVESLDYDPTEAVGKIEGFVRSKTCKGLRLSGGECDAIHIFWNRKTKSLDWWRL
jgi:hypothetical protein